MKDINSVVSIIKKPHGNSVSLEIKFRALQSRTGYGEDLHYKDTKANQSHDGLARIWHYLLEYLPLSPV